MDETKRAALLHHVLSMGGADTAVAVSVERFLDGNDFDGCIDSGFDLDFEVLRASLVRLRERPDVAAVFMELDLLPAEDDGEWPYCNGIGVYTSLPAARVAELLSDIEVEANGYPDGTTFTMPGAPPVPAGMAYVGVWWD